MAYHDDLLSQARHLSDGTQPTQADVRRAVSSAYYAVFHMLIAEATSNWSNAKLRPALSRAYDHGTMKNASNRVMSPRDYPYTEEDPAVVDALRFVARSFVQLQENRHFADYNLTKDLDPTDGVDQVKLAEKIFDIWPSIRDAQITQEYLVSLIVRR